MRLAYSHLYSDIENRDGEPIYNHGNQNRISLFSSWKLRDDLELDVWWRYVDNDSINTISAGRTEVDSYSTVDLRLGWRPRKDLELSLVAANLFGGTHLEFVQETLTVPVEVEPSLYGTTAMEFLTGFPAGWMLPARDRIGRPLARVRRPPRGPRSGWAMLGGRALALA
ncbi:MAG: hypothetical protein V9H25_15120 [Candidatus Competibacter sp.]